VGVGTGFAAVPDYGRIFAPNFDVRFIELRNPEIRRRYYIYQRRGLALSPPAEAFVKLLRQRAARGGG
jgi:DNA-binding transcriptional LysR family regulator